MAKIQSIEPADIDKFWLLCRSKWEDECKNAWSSTQQLLVEFCNIYLFIWLHQVCFRIRDLSLRLTDPLAVVHSSVAVARGLSCSEADACGILVPQPGIRPLSKYCKVNS